MGRVPLWTARARARAMGLLILVSLAAACREAPPTEPASRLVERARVSMGSELRLTAWTPDTPAALRAFDAVFAEFDRLESLMSIWRPGSDVQRLNAAAGRSPVKVSPEVVEVLLAARQVSEWTDGKFDVTFAALADVWRFDHDQDNRVPSPEEIQERLPLIDYSSLQVDREAGTAFLKHAGMRAHLGGIAKGYAIDRGAAILRGQGIVNFMIQGGGDLYVAGEREGRPWRLGINDPRGRGGESFATIDLSDATFSTSGDYERFFFKDGRRFHHLLDPDTGEPASGSRSVTILAPSALLADGLSTGVFILGPGAGFALIESLPEVEGVIVTSLNQVLVSSGLSDRLAMRRPPTDAP